MFSFGTDKTFDVSGQTKVLYKHPSAGWKVRIFSENFGRSLNFVSAGPDFLFLVG